MDLLKREMFEEINGETDNALTDEQPTGEQARERFKITSGDQANWALRKIIMLDAETAETNRLADTEIQKINEWRERQNSGCAQTRAFFTALLHEYHISILKEDSNKKTVKLPYGTLKMRAQQPKIERDEDALLTWTKANKPDFVLTVEKPKWDELKRVLKIMDNRVINPETGEVVPGITVTPRPDKFSVEVKE